MKNNNVKKLVTAAMLAAMVCVATMVIQISIPGGGYINLGDAFVLLSGFILGPLYGGIAAGIGSCIADLIAFPAYAPATFVIKFFVAFVASIIFSKGKSKISCIIGSIVGELIMIFGYFLYEAVFVKLGLGAAVGIPFNAIQGSVGAVIAFILISIFSKNKALKQIIDV
ncbi:MAG: ECF transporter S component [Clostridia bacterium]|nr:ECF transporter S component [Clostridia bacterium]